MKTVALILLALSPVRAPDHLHAAPGVPMVPPPLPEIPERAHPTATPTATFTPVPLAPAPAPLAPPEIQALLTAHSQPGWDLDSWATLIYRESTFNPKAQNPTSTAYGLGQFLNSTWDDVGCVKTSDPGEQIRCMALYIAQRYGTPQAALSHSYSRGWY